MPENVMTAKVFSLPGEENITVAFVVSRYRLKFMGDIEFPQARYFVPDVLQT